MTFSTSVIDKKKKNNAGKRDIASEWRAIHCADGRQGGDMLCLQMSGEARGSRM